MLKYLVVGIGGALGSVVRFWVGTYIGSRLGGPFPIRDPASSTLRVPFSLACSGCPGGEGALEPVLEIPGADRFLGGYTTFSNFEYETLRTIQDGQIGLGLLYVAASVVVGFAAVWGGIIAGRAIP